MEKYCRAGQDTDGNMKWRMRIACRITRARDTHSQYVTLIAFPPQQCLHERTSILRYTHLNITLHAPQYYATRTSILRYTHLNITLHAPLLPPLTTNLPMISISLIYNNNNFTSICHYLEHIHCLCCCARLSFVYRT